MSPRLLAIGMFVAGVLMITSTLHAPKASRPDRGVTPDRAAFEKGKSRTIVMRS